MAKTIAERALEIEERLTCHMVLPDEIEEVEQSWRDDPRWQGIIRPYSAEEMLKLRGTLTIDYTFATIGAKRLWQLINTKDYVAALGALTGNQAVQQVEAGLQAIYLSGWQVAADANLAGEMYPDQSLYPANSVPAVVRRINNALRRADQIQVLDCRGDGPYWFAPIVADAEAGFGGPLNAYELMKQMIDAGAAGVHFEDQLASAKKCGHLGGKVLVPTGEFITKLVAARLAADVCNVPTVLVARTDADAATLLTSDIDERDQPFILDETRTSEGFYRVRNGVDAAIARGLSHRIPRQAAGLQLFALLQLESPPGRCRHRAVPAGIRGHGVQVPVRDPGRFPCLEPGHVQPGAIVQGTGDAGLFQFPAGGVRAGEKRRLQCHHPPALRGGRLLRPPDEHGNVRSDLCGGPHGIHRRRTILSPDI